MPSNSGASNKEANEIFTLRRSEHAEECLREFEQAIRRQIKKAKGRGDKQAATQLDFAHLVVLELLTTKQTVFCEYTMREYARKVFGREPKGFHRAWRETCEAVQSLIDMNTPGAAE